MAVASRLKRRDFLKYSAAQGVAASLPGIAQGVEASLYGDLIDPQQGQFQVPTGSGLGRDPDPDVIKTYRVSST